MSKKHSKLPQINQSNSKAAAPSNKIPSQSARPTNAEYELRVTEVVKLLSDAYDRASIVRYAANKWGIGSRAVDDLLARAKEEMREINKETLEDVLAFATKSYSTIFRKAMSKDRYSEAQAAVTAICKLRGLDQQNIHLTVEKIDPELERLHPDEITRMLQEDNE